MLPNFLLTFCVFLLSTATADISLESQSIEVSITDRYAVITYLFEFENANSNDASELSFEISLQPNTFISQFVADLNGRLFIGETKEKGEALTEYNDAVDSGLNAVLVSQG